MSEVDLNKVQEFDFYHSQEFKSHIYDKSDHTVRWMGNWWSIIDAEVHIKWTKAVKEDYSQCLTGLLKTQLAPTKDIVFRR